RQMARRPAPAERLDHRASQRAGAAGDHDVAVAEIVVRCHGPSSSCARPRILRAARIISKSDEAHRGGAAVLTPSLHRGPLPAQARQEASPGALHLLEQPLRTPPRLVTRPPHDELDPPRAEAAAPLPQPFGPAAALRR